MSIRIHKYNKEHPSELELSIARFMNELQGTSGMRDVLSELLITGAKEFEGEGKKLIVVRCAENKEKKIK